jgi:hypothetical protein
MIAQRWPRPRRGAWGPAETGTHDIAGSPQCSESLREDGRGALGFALENALGADKSECQNRDVRVGNRVRR